MHTTAIYGIDKCAGNYASVLYKLRRLHGCINGFTELTNSIAYIQYSYLQVLYI